VQSPPARAYLTRLPGAHAEVVVFDRKLHPRHGRLVPVATARADLEKLAILPQNGSQLDSALGYADALLAAEPAQLPRRILVLTDGRTRSSLTPDSLASALVRSRALLHVAVVQAGTDALLRDDEHPWSRVTRPTGGLVWTASVSAAGDPNDQTELYEEWVRPKAIDHLRVTPSSDTFEDSFSLFAGDGEAPDPERLLEGEGRDLFGISAELRPFARLEGELWTERVDVRFNADEQAGKRWSALVFGTPLRDQLSEPEMMVLARHGEAVSPVTSFLAIEPGVRPSTEGLDWGDLGGLGEGIGLGSVGTVAYGRGNGTGPFDFQKYLEQEVSRSFAQCGGGARAGKLELETTLSEIVDVTTVELNGHADLALENCLREAVWSLALPRDFRSPSATWTIRI
jgi:hypothetical protein